MACQSRRSTLRCIPPKPATTILSSRNSNNNANLLSPVIPVPTPAMLESEQPIFCSSCDQILDGPCVRHSSKHIMDIPPLPLAISSLPDELALRSVTLSRNAPTNAVFARVIIPQSTIFGPLVSPLGNENQFTPAAFAVLTPCRWMGCSLESDHTCNWMKFVRLASNKKEQNLLAYQQNGGIYFSALNDIQPNDELKVWYCHNYAALLGKPSLSHEEPESINEKITEKVITEKVITDGVLDSDADPEFEVDAEDSEIDSEVSQESKVLTRKPVKTARTSSQISRIVSGKKRLPFSYQCEQCYGQFQREVNLEIHMYAHQDEIPDEFPDHISERCIGCGLKFTASTFPELVSHMNKHLRKGQVFKTCEECGKKFDRNRKLVRHIHNVHVEGLEESEPLRRRSRNSPQKSPMKLVKKRMPFSHQCQQCNGRFQRKDSLEVHMYAHEDKVRRQFPHHISEICGRCKFRASTFPELVSHMDEHRRRRHVFKTCAHCEEKFYHTRKLERHLLRVHGKGLEKTQAENPSLPLEYDADGERKRDTSEHSGGIFDLDYEKSQVGSEFEVDAEVSEIDGSDESKKLTHRTPDSSKKPRKVKRRASEPYWHQCQQCYGQFQREDNLEIHKFAHQDVLPKEFPDDISEECSRCIFTASTFPELVSHMDKHLRPGHAVKAKSNRNEMKCFECSTVYRGLEIFKIHCVAHGRTMPEVYITRPVCPSCKEECSSPEALREHVETHARKLPVYNCQFCEDQFNHNYELRNHCRKKHKDLLGQLKYTNPERGNGNTVITEGGFPCPTCGERFASYNTRRTHETVHLYFDGNYPCQVCLKTFDSKKTYVNHIPEHNVDGAYPCRFCDKVFPGFQKLRIHMMRFHTGKLLKCEICGYSTRRPYRLNRHMLIHTDKFDFKCKECPREFKEAIALRNHIEAYHNPDKPTKNKITSNRLSGRNSSSDYMNYVFKCLDCKLGFTAQRHLIRHLSDFHPDKSLYSIPELNLPVTKAVKYECSVCKKVFISDERRATHIQSVHPEIVTVVVSGEANCNPEFVLPPQRDVDFMIYWCPLCDLRFTSPAALLHHAGLKHPGTSLDVGNITRSDQ